MSAVVPVLRKTAAVVAGTAVAGLGYASLIERNAFVVRELTMPVLTPGSTPLRVLHLSDIHMRPTQRYKQAWLRELSRWEPDLVVNTGDTQDRLFLYRPGTGTDQLIDLMTSNFKTYTINGTYTPVVAYFGFGLGKSILWYAPGSAPDPQWDWNGSTFVNTTTRSVNGTYTPVVGRFSNTGTYVESILWVSLTGGSSPLWTMNGSVTSRNVTLPAGGTPLVIYGIN